MYLVRFGQEIADPQYVINHTIWSIPYGPYAIYTSSDYKIKSAFKGAIYPNGILYGSFIFEILYV